jgi:galactonate dehydratase
VALPTRPGLGFTINEAEAQQNVEYREELGGQFYHPADGSVVDW